MADADEAYVAAKRLISEVEASGRRRIDFSSEEYRALVELPPEIARLEWLQEIDLSRTSIADNGLISIYDLVELREIELDSLAITDVTLDMLRLYPHLRRVSLIGTNISDDGVGLLKIIRDLEELFLSSTGVTDRSVDHFSEMLRLKSLWISSTRISCDSIHGIVHLKNIDTLSMSGIKMSNTSLSAMGKFPLLEYLHLDRTEINDDLCSIISRNKKLRSLSIESNYVTDLGALQIATLPEIATLYISGNRVTEEGIRAFSSASELKKLELNGTLVSGLRPILNIPKLRVGSVKFNNIPALDLDNKLKLISQITDDAARSDELFSYLESLSGGWPPPQIDVPQQDDLLRVQLGDDGRIDVLQSRPTDRELIDSVKRKAHSLLVERCESLAAIAGNRLPRLATSARRLCLMLDRPFDEIDMLGVHFDLEGLRGIYERRNEFAGEERLDPDVVTALDAVLILGPGLVLDNPEVEKLEARRDRYRMSSSVGVLREAQDGISSAIISSPTIFGETARSYSVGFRAGSQYGIERLAVGQQTLNRNTVITVALLAAQPIMSGPMSAIGNDAVVWLAQHHAALSAAMPGWGDAMRIWLTPIVTQARETYSVGKYISRRL